NCNAEKPKRRKPAPQTVPASNSSGEKSSSPSVGSSTTGPAPHLHGAPGAKLCRVCGKDLTNRSRLRDDYGYICKACADKEDAGEITKPTGPKPSRGKKKGSTADLLAEDRLMKCPECNRKLKPGGMVPYRGKLICKSCHVYHEENDGLKVAKVDLKGHDVHAREQVKKLAIIAAVVLLIALGNLVYYAFIKD
ncbi:MAG TPA: hypothetical protein PK402_11800, partial [Tepidisphaeraceae bacterium]|nr:hypothetical protein [Tepidisphaeraceae bacterium]